MFQPLNDRVVKGTCLSFFLASVAISLFALSASAQKGGSIGTDEYLFIAEVFGGSKMSRAVLVEETLVPKLTPAGGKSAPIDAAREELIKGLPGISDAAITNLFARNDRSYKWSDKEKRFELVSRSKIDKIFGKEFEDTWTLFFREFPSSRGYNELSRVGFNAGGDQALVFRIWSCGSSCRKGSYLFFVKNRDRWEEKGELVRYLP